MQINPIQFKVEVSPTTEHVNEKGEYVFGIYTSNCCDDDIEKAIQSVAELWETQHLEAEVTLTINVKIRDIYENLFHVYNSMKKIEVENMPLFEALKNDCQWIVDQINTLEVIK
jgi:hypothetical protein